MYRRSARQGKSVGHESRGGEWVAPVTVATKPRVVMGTRIIDIAFTWKLDMDMDVDVDVDEDVNVPTLAPSQGPATGVLRAPRVDTVHSGNVCVRRRRRLKSHLCLIACRATNERSYIPE